MVVVCSNLQAAHGVLIERTHAQPCTVQDDSDLMHQRRACTRRVVESHERASNLAGVDVRREKGIGPLTARQGKLLAGVDKLAGLYEAGLLDGHGTAALVVFVPHLRKR